MERVIRNGGAISWHFAAKIAVLALQQNPTQPDALATIRQMATICEQVNTAGLQDRKIDLFGSVGLEDDTTGFIID